MRAMVLRTGELRVDHVADPTPGPDQIVVRSLACAICASDLHMIHHGRRLAEWSRDHSGPFDFDPDADLVLGHEFCGEVVDHGPGVTDGPPIGARVVSAPLVFDDSGLSVLGYSNHYPGGFGEYLTLSTSQVLTVPDSVETDVAALMEPLSVGFQYVRAADPRPDEAPMVIGCGAIGLAVVAALARGGHGPIIASDYSAHRRRLAEAMGADAVVDPAADSPFPAWAQHAPRGAGGLIFECVGAPGVLDSIFTDAPWFARIIVAGQNLDDDTFFTASAHTKGLNVQFGGAPAPQDYSGALAAIASGAVDTGSWITGTAPLDEAVAAVNASTDAERHTRIVVHPHG